MQGPSRDTAQPSPNARFDEPSSACEFGRGAARAVPQGPQICDCTILPHRIAVSFQPNSHVGIFNLGEVRSLNLALTFVSEGARQGGEQQQCRLLTPSPTLLEPCLHSTCWLT